MVIERLVFVPMSGANNFRITEGVLLADGAYARYSGHVINIGTNPSAANVLVAVIGREEDDSSNEQNIVFRLANRSAASATHVNGNLVVATVTGRPDGGWNLVGVPPSPIRIPDRTIAGTKLTSRAVGNYELANNAVQDRNIANNAVLTSRIADRQVTNAKLADNSVCSRTINGRAVTNANISGRLTSAQLPARSAARPTILARNGWTVEISSWSRHFNVGHGSINVTPPANWAGLNSSTGTGADVLVGIVNDPAFIPIVTANFTEMQSNAVFSFSSTTGELIFRSSSRPWGSRVSRNVRGMYMLVTPLG